MANPKGSDSGAGMPGDRNEFLEIYNNSNETIDLTGWQLTDFDATDGIIAWSDPKILARYPKIIINSIIIPAHRYAVILDPEYTSDDTTGGYVEPYSFPDSTLILTIGNTTLGDGLSTTDPVLLYAPASAESTSFGTPFDTTDSLPADAGDGTSWERITPDSVDAATNWLRCLCSTGSTPGSANSTVSFRDLALGSNDISFAPDPAQAQSPVTIKAIVHNRSFMPITDWQLLVFDDSNHDRIEQPLERLTALDGSTLAAEEEIAQEFVWARPPAGVHTIGVALSCPADQDSSNNCAFADLAVCGTNEYLKIVNSPFNPENDTAVIDYYLPEPGGYLTIAIYDLAGRSTKILEKKKIAAIQGRVFWNGRNENDRTMPVGIYIVNLEYRAGNLTYQSKKALVVAKPL